MTAEFDPSSHPEFAEIWARAQPYTMTSPARGFALYQAVNAVIDNDIPGSIVECGVWRGGSAMIIALTLLRRGVNRALFLFDTFEGMTAPSDRDVDFNDNAASDLMAGSQGDEIAELVTAAASLDAVKTALASTGYNMGLVRFVKGDVAETLPRTSTLGIALLRLDTDFYDSTLAELHHLWPRLAPRGPFIVDDYGHWKGARQAFHDYFDDANHGYRMPLLWRIDYTGYGGVKLQERTEVEIARYDYTPPGFDAPDLLALFPHAEEQSPWTVNWPHLRCTVPHIWRSDIRDDKPWKTGNASVEEAACLYTLARQFEGKRGLEIGTHFGWTAAHLVAAGLRMDCIDPEFDAGTRLAEVRTTLEKVGGTGTFRLWGGFSPDVVGEARASGAEPWNFAFIDGSHDGDGPRNDALAVIPHLADDALVVFHDLTSPFVERGLYAMRRAGFKTRLFNTMQILGIATRGDVRLPAHLPDPNVQRFLPMHLHKYEVSE